MDMSSMGGMSMGMNMFQSTNMELARDFWIIIAGVLGSIAILRALNLYQSHERIRRSATASVKHPTRPSNGFQRMFATSTAILREMSYPQLQLRAAWISWISPPPLGRSLVLLVYWAVIAYMMASETSVKDAYFWERIGFRNAWITTMQVPLVYLLASKFSILGLIVGAGHERLNWLHRWVARTMLVTATVHGFYFYTEWVQADLVEMQMSMPMIRYGFAAWAVLLWSFLISLGPLRNISYEFFVAQHVISAIVFLWLVYVHVPAYAQSVVWISVAALASDRLGRTMQLIRNNFKLKTGVGRRLGHPASVRALGLQTTVLTIENVGFNWRAGQHIYLWLPGVGPTQTHPYTVAGIRDTDNSGKSCRINLVVRKHSGFSRRLHRYASQAGNESKTLTAFVMGPYGHPPACNHYETLVLIAASTGASYTLSLLEGVVASSKASCVTRIDFLLMAKHSDEIEFYFERLRALIAQVEQKKLGLELSVQIAVTGDPGIATPAALARSMNVKRASVASAESYVDDGLSEKNRFDVDVEASGANPAANRREGNGDAEIQFLTTRPDVEEFIRSPVEAAGGESLVVVCGGSPLVATVRNFVSRLSDERAVHKGTGAQGICLHAEQYGF
ncbi:ferric reductase like transmembrane component [Colletotrichum karsti]|uniref:ferric-chelate reductase (NADPH) n=1 Tax=Colletotrichum karsti TaxID=1095194 RepID=A0A9P6I3Q0_9PEZI|nr:ferric reductase like transmembrane component [Colletotrichum karsti]KAF9875270.1 ferric reductase like transmembrane component [Colletotrichum karsti]